MNTSVKIRESIQKSASFYITVQVIMWRVWTDIIIIIIIYSIIIIIIFCLPLHIKVV